MAAKIGFFILIALGLIAVLASYWILEPVLLGFSLAVNWLVHPVVLPILLLLVPLLILQQVFIGGVLAWKGSRRAAMAVLTVPALIGFLTLTVGLI